MKFFKVILNKEPISWLEEIANASIIERFRDYVLVNKAKQYICDLSSIGILWQSTFGFLLHQFRIKIFFGLFVEHFISKFKVDFSLY